jgi:ubiquinone/menaquinone biosynthesis C-methylase UbiE
VRLYHEFAWAYDTIAAIVSRGRWSAWGRATLPYLSGHVLELGCGTGHLQRTLAEQPHLAPVGLDASAQMIKLTTQRLLGCPIRLIRAVAQSLPFPSAAFDSIVATFPSDYIVDRTTLGEARRVLRSGGRLVIVLAAAFERAGLYEALIDLAYRLTLQRSPHTRPDQPPRSLVGERLSQAGFAVDERWEATGGDRVHLVIGTAI